MNRSLGAAEHLLWRLSQTRPVNAVLCASLTGPLSTEWLRDALDAIQRRHALLAVRIRTDGEGRPYFDSEAVAPIPLRCLPRRDEAHWVYEVEEALTRPFAPEEGPLLRATLLQGVEAHELLLTFDHAIGDGMSAALLLRDLLRELSQPGTCQGLPPPVACEELLPPGLGRPPRAHLRVLPDGAPSVAAVPGSAVRLLTRDLSAEDTARLVEVSRHERTSVHGALCAAFLLALVDEAGSRDAVGLRVMSPVNLREHLSPPVTEAFVPCFARQLTRHRLSSTSPFWEVARDVKQQLQRDTGGHGKFAHLLEVKDFLATAPDAPGLQAFVKDVMGSELTVTNLGRWGHAEQYGALRLRRLHVTVSGLAPLIVGVTTVGGRLSLCSRFLESALPVQRALRIQWGAWERLQSALQLTSTQRAL
ncbi:phthiocerol/phthiodiolone dimycocerosyl transferase family protein [Pyxidicoccus xibeiensis]|uniref:phthiocerol/phthiodiolone dimycocerosyl transferase family protein n=1 Tax=Pyxidicoccus xibeiensis TaxID=2906759 RepID=UPI0020A7F688|nr:condensation domain-containing protein [Pyxidicoccus xibeiensis]MCP3139696.1 condensation domain-containing protein [Pyxidicoccus xibeiensis]